MRKSSNIPVYKRAVSAVLLAALAAAYSPVLNAEQRDVRAFLVGTWRVESAAAVTDTVFQPIGAFKTTIHVKGIADPAYCSGAWEIRSGSQLWMHNLAWYPIFERHYDGTKQRIHINEWDSTKVEIIDDNHVRTSAGISTRISR